MDEQQKRLEELQQQADRMKTDLARLLKEIEKARRELLKGTIPKSRNGKE